MSARTGGAAVAVSARIGGRPSAPRRGARARGTRGGSRGPTARRSAPRRRRTATGFAAAQALEHLLVGQLLGREQHELELAGRQALEDRARARRATASSSAGRGAVAGRSAASTWSRCSAMSGETTTVGAVEEQAGELVDRRLAGARGHDARARRARPATASTASRWPGPQVRRDPSRSRATSSDAPRRPAHAVRDLSSMKHGHGVTQAEDRRTACAEQRRTLPDEPGVYLFRDARGQRHLRRQGEVDPQAGRRRTSPTRSTRGRREMTDVDRPHRVRCVVATEAEALLAEQNFIKQYQPRFNIRLRDDKSYPYIAISLDEDFPRVYFTRERHRRDRAYFGPYSNAKRVRGTLDLLGKVFLFRSCEGPEPGRRSGLAVPGLLHQALRGALRRLRLQGGVPRGDRRRDRLPLRPLPRRSSATSSSACTRRPAEQDFEQAALERNRLQRGPLAARAPARRQRVASARSTRSPSPSTGTRPTPRSSRCATACSRDRQSLLPRQRGRARASREVAEEFILQYYAERDVDPGADRRPARARSDARRARPRRSPSAAAAGRDPRGRARRQAPHPRARRAQRAARARPGAAARPSAAASSASRRSTGCRRRSASTRCRCASSASTSPTSWARTRSPRWSCSRAARRRSPTTGASRSATLERGQSDDFAAMARGARAARFAQWERQHDLSPHDPELRRVASPRCPTSS